MKTFTKIFLNTLLALLVVLVLLFAAPRLVGMRMFSVLSGSMEPAYSTGDLIYVRPIATDELQVGDVISFVMNSQGTVATHRITEIDEENRQVYTKGDANEVSDGKAVKFENVIGKVVFAIPLAGYLIGFINTAPGKIITVTIIVSLILLVLLLQRLSGDEDEAEAEQKPVAAPAAPRRHVRRPPPQPKNLKRSAPAPAAAQPAAAGWRPEVVSSAATSAAPQPAMQKQQEFTPQKPGVGIERLLQTDGCYSHRYRYRPRYPQRWEALKEMEKEGWPLCPNTTENTATQTARPLENMA